MTKTKNNAARARYTLEFKLEAVRMVDKGECIAAAARSLGVVDQTLFNWVKLHKSGKRSCPCGSCCRPGRAWSAAPDAQRWGTGARRRNVASTPASENCMHDLPESNLGTRYRTFFDRDQRSHTLFGSGCPWSIRPSIAIAGTTPATECCRNSQRSCALPAARTEPNPTPQLQGHDTRQLQAVSLRTDRTRQILDKRLTQDENLTVWMGNFSLEVLSLTASISVPLRSRANCAVHLHRNPARPAVHWNADRAAAPQTVLGLECGRT